MSRVIVYDGECSLCARSARSLVRAGLVHGDGVAAWDDLAGEEAQRTWDAGFRNEMAVLDRDTGEIRNGAHGLMWVLRDSWLAPVAIVLDLPGLRSVTALVYRTVAYNRRLLAPPPTRDFVCACDPDDHRGYQWALIVVLVALSGIVAVALGALGARALGLGGMRAGAAVWFCACALGWAAPGLASLRLKSSVRMKYLGSLALAAFAGALIQLPAILALPWLGPRYSVLVLGAGLAAGFVWAWRMLRKRVHWLGLGPGWVRLWAASVLIAMLGTFVGIAAITV